MRTLLRAAVASLPLALGPLVAAVAGAEEPVEVQSPVERQFRQLELFATGGQDGRLVHVDCRRGAPPAGDGLPLAQQAALWAAASAEATRRGAGEPLAVHLGSSTFPGAAGRYLLADPPRGSAELVGLLAGVPYAVHGLGRRELSLPWPQLEGFLEAAADRGLILLADNLECAAGSRHPLCGAAARRALAGEPVVVEEAGLRVGFTSVLDPVLAVRVAASRLAGLELADPVAALVARAAALRDAGAEIVVALAHLPRDEGTSRALALARAAAGVDLLLTTRLAGLGSAGPAPAPRGHLVAPTTGAFVVDAESGPHAVVLAELELTRSHAGAPWRLHALRAREAPTAGTAPQPETAERLRRARQRLCGDWGRPIAAGVRLERPFELADFRLFVLNVLRFSHRAEVALLNTGAFRDGDRFPLTGELTLADLYTTLPFEDEVVVLELAGAELAGLAAQLGDGAVAAGLERSGGGARVNDRPVQAGRAYRVVTNRFLAEGGDAILERAGIDPVPGGEPPAQAATIHDLLIDFIRQGTFREGGRVGRVLSPEGNFPDLAERFLWTTTGTLAASYNRVDVRNPRVDDRPAFDQPQLTVRSTDQIHLSGEVGLLGESRRHGWESELQMHYAAARLDRDADDAGFEETRDLVLLKSLYRYLGFRADGRDEWWVPLPFVEGQLETEFVRPDDRDWRRLQVTGIAGARFRISRPLEAKLGVNARRDLEDPAGTTTYGINLGYTLRRTEVARLLDRPVRFDSQLEYFLNDIGDEDIQEIRSLSRLHFALTDRLFFTTSAGFFGYRSSTVGRWGTNTEITVGLSVLWGAARQRF